MPVLPVAIAVALGIVLLLRKARFHYERLPKVPYVPSAPQPDVEVIVKAKDDAAAPVLPAATAEWLLFTGAGTQYARVFLPSLAQYAMEENLDAVSVFLKHVPETMTGKILLPYTLALTFTGVNSARINAQPPGALFAEANCMLIRRETYEQLGGHDGLARAKWTRGRLMRAEHMGTATTGSFRYLVPDAVSRAQVALALVLLTAWLPVLVLLALGGYERQAVLFALAPSLVLFPWYRGPLALLAPVAIWLFDARMIQSIWRQKTGRGVPAEDRRGQPN